MVWGTLQSFNPRVPDILLEGEVVIDKRRKPITDAVLPRDKLSSPHCRIYQSNGEAFVCDMGSRNGTFLNQKKLEPDQAHPLVENDILTLAIPGVSHPHYDKERHFAFCFHFTSEKPAAPDTPSKRKKKFSKFDQKKKLVSSSRGVSVIATGGKGFTAKKSLETPEEYVGQLRFKPGSALLESLEAAIKKNDGEWTQTFLDIRGLACLLQELELRLKKASPNNLDKMIAYQTVRVIYQIMQQKRGFEAILRTPDALGIVALGLTCDHVKLQSLIPLLLAAVACLSAEGHQQVVAAMEYFAREKNDRTRFKRLVHSLKTEDDTEYQTNVMRLINAIVNKHDNLEKRAAVRQEFKLLGLVDIMEGLRYQEDAELDAEIDGFLEEMEMDSQEAMVNNVDLSDPLAIANALVSQTHGKALQYFTEIMQQLFSIPVGTAEGLATWRLAEDVIRSSTSAEPKQAPKKLDFQTIRKMKKTAPSQNLLQEDQEALRTELQTLQEEIRKSKLAHLEQVNELVDKHAAEKKELQRTLEQEIASLRDRLEAASTQQATPASAQPVAVPVAPTPAADIPAPPVDMPAPPPPPPSDLAPPPPPGLGMPGQGRVSHADKYPYHPAVQMKKFFWTTVKKRELTDTVWENVDFADIDYLEPVELEKLFGAKKKAQVQAAKDKVPENPYENLIDLKRANNIGIMLKHFKMAPSAIKKAILDVDETLLSTEKIAQLYRNAPTLEETDLLCAFSGDARELGKPEQFLLQMVQIPDVTERLELLQFRSNFDETVEDLKYHYNTITTGVEQVLQSRLLRDVCELILAVGNFLNYKQWSEPAAGFKIDFLTKVADTRTTDNTLTMVHYLTGLLADKKPEMLQLAQEMTMVGNASRIPASKLNTDVGKINNTVSQIKRLLKKETDDVEDTRFKEIMLSFSLHAKRELDILTEARNKLQTLSDQLVAYFPPSATLPIEEFLGIFSEFLLTFVKSHNDNEQEQANIEMKARIARKRAEREQAQAEKKQSQLRRPSERSKRGLMDGAFATIRGGGMKTFRPKRGPPPEPTPEELELMGDASPRQEPVVEDVMAASLEQPTVAPDSPAEPTPEATPERPPEVVQTSLAEMDQTDSGDLLQSLLDEMSE